MEKVQKSEEEWRQQLTSDQFRIARQGGTEPAFTGKYYKTKKDGVYQCVCCGAELFDADDKYESGSGWPSFTRPIEENNVEAKLDTSHGMRRTEVLCSRCDAHLGHVFNDGPAPTGKRFCINSASLELNEK